LNPNGIKVIDWTTPQKTDIKIYKYKKEIISLSVKHGLSSYDATYLELAMRKDGRLLTLDKKLSKIANDIMV